MTATSSRIQRRRSAFTLLEVLLASAIGLMLLGALYVTVDIQMRQMHIGGRSIEQGNLARGLYYKIAVDIAGNVSAPLPAFTTTLNVTAASTNTTGGSTSGGSTSGTSNTGSGTGNTSTTTGSQTSGSSGSGTSSAATATDAVTYNIGVLGDSSDLILSNVRAPKESLNPNMLTSGQQVIGLSDLRHVMWWLAGDGLARYELKPVTSADATTLLALPPSVPNEKSCIIAQEVKSLQFQYFDGTNWQDTWDSSQPSTLSGSDGVSPQGPPVAIAVTLGIQEDDFSKDSGSLDTSTVKTYRRVIMIPSANGTTIQPSLNSTTTNSASGSGTGGTTGQ